MEQRDTQLLRLHRQRLAAWGLSEGPHDARVIRPSAYEREVVDRAERVIEGRDHAVVHSHSEEEMGMCHECDAAALVAAYRAVVPERVLQEQGDVFASLSDIVVDQEPGRLLAALGRAVAAVESDADLAKLPGLRGHLRRELANVLHAAEYVSSQLGGITVSLKDGSVDDPNERAEIIRHMELARAEIKAAGPEAVRPSAVSDIEKPGRPTIFSRGQKKALRGEVVKDVQSVRGRPGGANNDHVRIKFESGKTLNLSIYALYETEASLVAPGRGTADG